MRLIFIIILTGLFSVGCTAREAVSNFEECKKSWFSIYDESSIYGASIVRNNSSIDELITSWKAYEGKCKNSGIYEAKLASLYFVKGDIAESSKVLENAKSSNKEYEAIINIYKAQNKLQTDINNQIGKALIRKKYQTIFDKFISDYPEYCISYESAATFYILISDYTASFNLAKKSVLCNADSWSGYKMMAINSAFLNDFSNTSDYCGKAQSINKHVTGDPYFMFSCAKGFAHKHDFETSDAIFTIINIKTPEAKNLPEYSETLKFVEQVKNNRKSNKER